MKKTCFVLSGNAYLCPYLFNFYVDNTPGEKYLVYWNRDGVEETLGSIKGIEYAKPCPDMVYYAGFTVILPICCL